MQKEFPTRCFDVGIAEQHAVTFAAGLAKKGMIPFCNIYSSFTQRAYDQIIHDVALQKLHVIMCLDRAGLVGNDGATHHGAFDISFLRCVPDLVIAAPMDEFVLRNLMYTSQLAKNKFPIVIRYPRGKSSLPKSEITFEEIPIGKGRCLIKGEDVAIVTVGTPGVTALKVAATLAEEGINISVYDMIFVKPLDKELLNEICSNHKYIISVEDNSIAGGFGTALLEYISDNEFDIKLKRFGIPDRFIEHGSQEQLIEECGYDYSNLLSGVKKICKLLIKC